MPKRIKIVVLEGETELSNADLVKFFTASLESGLFKLTQKPRVQVAQPAKDIKFPPLTVS